MKVTIFKDIKNTSAGFVKDVFYVLGRIQEGKSKSTIEKIRVQNASNDVDKSALKASLPSICFSGTFRHRSKQGLIKHSGLICLDFDKFPSDDEMKAWRDTFEGDLHTFALFTSPSGNGLKLIVKIPASEKDHKAHYEALGKYYNCPYFDSKTPDVSRVCFESYDPDIYINPSSEVYTDKIEKEYEDLGTPEPKVPLKSESRVIQNLLTWWNRKFGSTKGSRNSNAYILAAAFNDFGVKKDDAIYHMRELAEPDFNESEIESIIAKAYRKTEQHGTKFFEDYTTTERLEKQIRAGVSIKDLKKNNNDLNEAELETAIQFIKDTIAIDDFWTYDEEGKIKISHYNFKYWLEQKSIYKFFPKGNESFIFVRINENKVEIIRPEKIKDVVLKDLLQRADIGKQPFDLMASGTRFFKDDYLSFLETINVDFKEDDTDTCYLYYKDSAIKITGDTIEEINYIDLDGYVWGNQCIDRTFQKTDYSQSMFRQFVWLIAGKDEKRYNSLRSVIGYLLHSHKTSANNKCVIFNDEVISENPNGGSGKGLFCQGVSQIKKTCPLDGKQFDFNKSFPYQTVSVDTQVLIFDDVKKNFNIEYLFSLITEGITIERKNKDAIKIPVRHSPKVVILTNYTIGGIGGSFERRKFEVELSSHFGAHHTPLQEFGCLLFDDWNEKEWQMFDSFMVDCVQYYLTNGLVKSDFLNLETRKYIKETSFEFYEWAAEETLPFSERISKKEKFEEFIAEYPDLKKYLTQKRFATWLESYATYKRLPISVGKSGSLRYIIYGRPGEPIKEKEHADSELESVPF